MYDIDYWKCDLSSCKAQKIHRQVKSPLFGSKCVNISQIQNGIFGCVISSIKNFNSDLNINKIF